MITGKHIINRIFMVILALFLAGCMKFDTLPQLEIAVQDEQGAGVPGAYVGLFDSAEEWNRLVNPVQAWRRTGSDGKVLFVDLREITYYIYVRFDGKDNSLGEVSTADSLQMNQRSKIIIQVR